MDYDDERLPLRLRGQIRATEGTIRYLESLTHIVDPALRFGHADNLLDMQTKLTQLQEKAHCILAGGGR